MAYTTVSHTYILSFALIPNIFLQPLPPEARNFSPSLSLLTVIVAAESRLLVTSCSSFSRPSLISHQDKVFDSIPLADSTSPDSNSSLSSSIFLLPIYLFNGIPCTFIHCQFFNTSIPTTATFTDFAPWISRFARQGINNPVSTFLVRRAEIASDGA